MPVGFKINPNIKVMPGRRVQMFHSRFRNQDRELQHIPDVRRRSTIRVRRLDHAEGNLLGTTIIDVDRHRLLQFLLHDVRNQNRNFISIQQVR